MAPTLFSSHNRFLEPLREVWSAKVHILLFSQFLYFLGICVWYPHSATVLTNYFAGRHAEGAIECTNLAPGTQPPDACMRAHNDIIAWSALKSFLCSAVLGAFLTPLLCRWSDYYGRKPLLVYGMLMSFPSLLIFAAYFLFDFPLWWYYPTEILRGSFVSTVLMYAYISDVVSPAHRTAVFGIALTPFGISLMLGPIPTSMGWLTSPLVATLIALGLSIASLSVLVLFVPESLPSETKRLALQARTMVYVDEQKNRFGAIFGAAKDFWMSFKILFRTKYFFKLAVCMIILSMLFEEVMEIEVQYLQEVAGFGTKDQALLITAAGAGTLLVQSVGLWALVSVMQLSNKRLIILGLSLYFIKMVLLVVCSSKVVAYISVIVGTPVSIVFPATAAIKSTYVSKDEQGAVQGALGGAQSFAKGVGPIVFLAIYYFFRQGRLYFPGAPFVVCAVLLLIAIIVAITIKLPIIVSKLDGIEFVEHRNGDTRESLHLLPSEGRRNSTEEEKIQPL